MGTGPIRVSYLRTFGEAKATTWEILAGSACSVEADGTGGSHVP